MSLPELEASIRWLLANAATQVEAAGAATPESPSVDYLTGFRAGSKVGEMQTLAHVLSLLTGSSIRSLVEEALAGAAIDRQYPFELQVQVGDEAA